MLLEDYKKYISNIIPLDRLLFDSSMKLHTTFKIGGTADIIALPSTTDEINLLLKSALDFSIPVEIIGNGSNLLVLDGGIRGLVIKLSANFNSVKVKSTAISAQSGISLSALAQIAAQNSLTGIEFLSGIPGTLGGAIYMNAGAYGMEIKDVLQSVTAIDQNQVVHFDIKDLCFQYRHSVFSDKNMLILDAELVLCNGQKTEIDQKMKEYSISRRAKQPINIPSAGSVFKRPPNAYAAALIDNAGLKGLSVGGAQVSEKHAGFIVNKGDATAKDVLELIKQIKEIVNIKTGVLLETEIRILGDDKKH